MSAPEHRRPSPARRPGPSSEVSLARVAVASQPRVAAHAAPGASQPRAAAHVGAGASQPRIAAHAAPGAQPKIASQARVPAHTPGASQPRVAAVSQPRVAAAAKPEPKIDPPRSYVAIPAAEPAIVGDIQPLRTHFFQSINEVQALTLQSQQAIVDVEPRELGELRGYAREDLLAIAEVAYHYLMNGGVRLAVVLFEGLAAIAPREAYFAMGTGLAHDHAGNKAEALRWYELAGQLDPNDPRADINRAELHIERRERKRAIELLQAAAKKAERRRDEALQRKATAILGLLKPAA
jgi:hypothetical protein